MITRTSLPANYTPYQNLTICSNSIRSEFLILVGEIVPLLIGSGEIPKIWLQAPTDQSGRNFIPLVLDSVSAHGAVTVTSDRSTLSIFAGGTQLVHITQQSRDSAVIDVLDLRPIGFDVFGTASSLRAGGMSFTSSHFSTGSAMFSFGE
jgi:hypothetical protein